MAIPKKVTMDNLFFRECIVKRNAMVSNGEYRADLEKDIKRSEERRVGKECRL